MLATCIGAVGGAAAAWVVYHRLGPIERVVSEPVSGGSGGGPATVNSIAGDHGASVVTVATQPVSVEGLAAGPSGFANGFVISPDGLVVTSARAVAGATRLRVGLGDGRAYDAVIAGADPAEGIVILRLAGARDLPALMVSRRSPQAGDFTLVLARPPLETLSVVTGTVSSAGRTVAILVAGSPVRVQALVIAAVSSPAAEGAPVLDDRGDVIGMVTEPAAANGPDPPPGTIALRGRPVAALVDRLGRAPHVAPVSLGIDAVPLDPATAAAVSVPSGALVRAVAEGGPAASAGISSDDIITAVNGAPVDADHPLETSTTGLDAGQRVTLTVVTRGQSRNVSVVAIPR